MYVFELNTFSGPTATDEIRAPYNIEFSFVK